MIGYSYLFWGLIFVNINIFRYQRENLHTLLVFSMHTDIHTYAIHLHAGVIPTAAAGSRGFPFPFFCLGVGIWLSGGAVFM